MRLWHKDLISVLPRQQLLGQWRECCLIAKNIKEKGTPNHILVNRVMDYPIEHFYAYSVNVYDEMCRRGYKVNLDKFIGVFPYDLLSDLQHVPQDEIFNKWHDRRYLTQCFYNLQEKYDCGGISTDEWSLVKSKIECLLDFNQL